MPEGSKRSVSCARADSDIVRTTSSFVDVVTTAREVVNKLGMMSELVLPLRLGPTTKVDRSGPLVTSPRAPRPRYTPMSVITHNGHEQNVSMNA